MKSKVMKINEKPKEGEFQSKSNIIKMFEKN